MKRPLIIGTLVIAIMSTLSAAVWQVSKSRSFQCFGGIVRRVETDEKIVALTFDDGPSAAYTGEVLRVLAALDVKATFFVTGAELAANMAQGKQIVAAGHELGNHTYSHKRMVFKSPAFIRQEIEATDRLIRSAGYRGAIHFRAPGCKKLILLPWYLRRHNRKSIVWDVEPESDPKTAADAAKIAAHVTARVRPGSIVLLHVMYDGRAESRRAVGGIVRALRAEGYSFVTVSALLAAEGSTVTLDTGGSN
ncbi:MAG: polysaccharide deacetylase family protein [Bacteroidota bacterium]